MTRDAVATLESLLGERPRGVDVIARGHTGPVLSCVLAGGRTVVAKLSDTDDDADALAIEARMLARLAQHAPAPRVVAHARGALVMERVDGGTGAGDDDTARDLAQVLARLHAVTAARFGYDEDTRIGGLVQQNAWTSSWPAFFAERRLLAMARAAQHAGRVDGAFVSRVEALAARIDDVVDAPDAPRLIHGDLWSGNILCARGEVRGLIDPALCFADAELDLSLLDLFGVGDAFWPAYFALRPPRPGREVRARLYTLWPLLVHARLFGGGYVRDAGAVLAALGF